MVEKGTQKLDGGRPNLTKIRLLRWVLRFIQVGNKKTMGKWGNPLQQTMDTNHQSTWNASMCEVISPVCGCCMPSDGSGTKWYKVSIDIAKGFAGS